ncbi:MAG TPA: GntR family transcriptional regulator [Aquiluna sp.]
MDESGRPIFLQLAEQLENQIISGQIAEQVQVPSINELAAFHRINPATALKAINQLVDEGTLYKKRGIGMFVAEGARKSLVEKHSQKFKTQFVDPLVIEAQKLGITDDQIIQMLKRK